MRLERIQGRPPTAETEDVIPDTTTIDSLNDSAVSDKDDAKKEATKSRRPRRRRNNTSSEKTDDKKLDVEQETEQDPVSKADENAESQEKPIEERTPRRRRRGRRGGRRRNNGGPISAGEKDKEPNEKRHDDDGLETESGTSGKDKNPLPAPPKEETLVSNKDNQSVATGDATKRVALKNAGNSSSSTKAETEVKSEVTPKRGWWQRITK